jgi:hypothetical protein
MDYQKIIDEDIRDYKCDTLSCKTMVHFPNSVCPNCSEKERLDNTEDWQHERKC